MAGFSIMLMNFVLLPLFFLIAVVGTFLLFGAGCFAAAGVIFLFHVITGRRRDRVLYVRTPDPGRATALLQSEGARRVRTMLSSYPIGPALVQARVAVDGDIDGVMNKVGAGVAVTGMYVG